ncbi:hypothetical protein BGX38DRAFT_1187267 [Terfezia claveryi]|nr:hypothetical protein BGX38DRAFT_1187267 [Terfezia claveryi]
MPALLKYLVLGGMGVYIEDIAGRQVVRCFGGDGSTNVGVILVIFLMGGCEFFGG